MNNPSLQQAATVLRDGGVIIHPTATVYGFACLATSSEACARIRTIKGNVSDKPLLMITDQFERISSWIKISSPLESKVMAVDDADLKLTILFDANSNCPQGPLGSSQQVGIRKTTHALSKSLIELSNSALVSTSANLQGEAAVSRYNKLNRGIIESVDLVLSDDEDLTGLASTIIRVEKDKVHILRSDKASVSRLGNIFGLENIVSQET